MSFSTGPVELKVNYTEYGVQSIRFSFDLDSVYKTSNEEIVYMLDRVEVDTRNIWQLIITVELIDGLQQKFTSKGFRIRTKPKPPKPAAGKNAY